MVTYKFNVASKNSLICEIIDGNSCKKLRGKKALNLFLETNKLDLINYEMDNKKISFYTINSKIVFENPAKFNYLNIISFDDKVKELISIVKINNIKYENERIEKERKALLKKKRLLKIKKALYSTAASIVVGITSFTGVKNHIHSKAVNKSAINYEIDNKFQKADLLIQKESLESVKESLVKSKELAESTDNSEFEELKRENYFEIKNTKVATTSSKNYDVEETVANMVKCSSDDSDVAKTLENVINSEEIIEEKEIMNTDGIIVNNIDETALEEQKNIDNINHGLSISNMANIVKMMRQKGFSEEEYPYYTREDGVKMLGNYIMIASEDENTPIGTIVDTEFGASIVVNIKVDYKSNYNTSSENFAITTGNKEFDLTPEELDFITAIVAHESDNSYEDSLATASVIFNRCEAENWVAAHGEDPIEQIKAPGQFSVYASGAYLSYLNGNSPEAVQQAVKDAANGTRNCKYLSFRSNKTTSYSNNLATPTGNRYR